MMYVPICFLMILLDVISPKKNIVLLVDTSCRYHNNTRHILEDVVRGISLRRYRISVYSTSGVSVGIYQFNSRQCILEKFEQCKSPNERSISKILDDNFKDTFQPFQDDDWNVLVITDKKKTMIDKEKIKQISKGKTSVFYINVKKRAQHDAMDLPFVDSALGSCKDTSRVHDECGRICQCKDGTTTDCYRLRKEFSKVDIAIRKRYLFAYMAVFSDVRYRDESLRLIADHTKWFYKGIHGAVQFLPWHRKFMLTMENLLRLVDCRVTIPFWNWPIHSDHIWSTTPNYHMWDIDGGLGGSGNLNTGYCVPTGYFNYANWTIRESESDRRAAIHYVCRPRDPCPVLNDTCKTEFRKTWNETTPELESCIKTVTDRSRSFSCVRRRFANRVQSYDEVYNKFYNFTSSEFKEFEQFLQYDLHNDLHDYIGGHMEGEVAAFAPEFWLLHSMVDGLWDRFQQRGKEFAEATNTNRSTVLLIFQPLEYARNYLNLSNLVGCGVRVKYEGVLNAHPDQHRETSVTLSHHDSGDKEIDSDGDGEKDTSDKDDIEELVESIKVA